MNKCSKVKVCIQSIQYLSDERHSSFPFHFPIQHPKIQVDIEMHLRRRISLHHSIEIPGNIYND